MTLTRCWAITCAPVCRCSQKIRLMRAKNGPCLRYRVIVFAACTQLAVCSWRRYRRRGYRPWRLSPPIHTSVPSYRNEKRAQTNSSSAVCLLFVEISAFEPHLHWHVAHVSYVTRLSSRVRGVIRIRKIGYTLHFTATDVGSCFRYVTESRRDFGKPL